MALVVGAAQLKARLTQKTACRPTEMTRRKMPNATGLLEQLPVRDPSAPAGEQAANKKYMAEIDGVAHAFGGQKRSQGTEDECLKYVMAVEAWLVRSKFGSYFIPEHDADGRLAAVRPQRDQTGELKVVPEQLIVGMLLEMATGSKNAPKGRGAAEIESEAEVPSATGLRRKMRCASASARARAHACMVTRAMHTRAARGARWRASMPGELGAA